MNGFMRAKKHIHNIIIRHIFGGVSFKNVKYDIFVKGEKLVDFREKRNIVSDEFIEINIGFASFNKTENVIITRVDCYKLYPNFTVLSKAGNSQKIVMGE